MTLVKLVVLSLCFPLPWCPGTEMKWALTAASPHCTGAAPDPYSGITQQKPRVPVPRPTLALAYKSSVKERDPPSPSHQEPWSLMTSLMKGYWGK